MLPCFHYGPRIGDRGCQLPPAECAVIAGKETQTGETGNPPRDKGKKAQGTYLFLLEEKAGLDTCTGPRSTWPRARPRPGSRAGAGLGSSPGTYSRTCAETALQSSRAPAQHPSPSLPLPLRPQKLGLSRAQTPLAGGEPLSVPPRAEAETRPGGGGPGGSSQSQVPRRSC